jgi:Ca-activated chloride channel family protein
MVIDTSGSMNAADDQPSRLAAARSAGRAFLDQLPPRFRVAVVTFASTARVALLPTTDRAAARAALDALRADGGTAMGDAIARAVEVAQSVRGAPAGPAQLPAPPPGTGGPRAPTPSPAVPTPGSDSGPQGAQPEAILLLSDGANTAGRVQPLEAAAQAQRLGIPVYAVALGTPGGVLPIQGRRVAVPPDEATLRQIAEATGGQFFAAPTERDLRAVYQEIGSRVGFEYEQHEITFAFAGAGAVLLAAGGALAVLWFNRFP